MPKKTKRQKQQAVQRRIIPPKTITVEPQSSRAISNPSLQYSLPTKGKETFSKVSVLTTHEDDVLFTQTRRDIMITLGLSLAAVSALFALSIIIT